jgi:ELL-associated factor
MFKGSTQKYTQFTGNKQATSLKDCILIYDTKTKEFTLERLESNFNLKRSRLEGASKAQIVAPRSITPTVENHNKKKPKNETKTPVSQPTPTNNNSKNNNSQLQKEVHNKSSAASKDVTPPPKSPKSVSQINAGKYLLNNFRSE